MAFLNKRPGRSIELELTELRYDGKSKVAEATNDKAADRARALRQRDDEERSGPAIPMNKLFDLHLADLRRMKRESVRIVEQHLDKYVRPVFGAMDAAAITKGGHQGLYRLPAGYRRVASDGEPAICASFKVRPPEPGAALSLSIPA